MKGKTIPKIQRRAAGLQIRAVLEPRPNSGNNLAADIFNAVKENEASEAKSVRKKSGEFERPLSQSINQAVKKELTSTQKIADSLETSASNESESEEKIETAAGTTLMRFGSGQMRVVSLQSSKSRKANKEPKKQLKIVTGEIQTGKIPILFERTKAEELYDLLYQLTLGADEPCETVRVRRSDLMASTNIKTRLTLDLNLKRLEENNLLKIESRPGEQEGNFYTVFPIPTSDKR